MSKNVFSVEKILYLFLSRMAVAPLVSIGGWGVSGHINQQEMENLSVADGTGCPSAFNSRKKLQL